MVVLTVLRVFKYFDRGPGSETSTAASSTKSTIGSIYKRFLDARYDVIDALNDIDGV